MEDKIGAINKSTSDKLSIKFPTNRDDARDAALGFQSISQQGCLWNCVTVLDGYHLQIQTLSKAEARNVRSFFSGHYQGKCPSGMWPQLNQISLGKLIEQLPGSIVQ